MTGKTHSAAGILVGAAVATHYQLDIFEMTTSIVLSALASIFPDICHTKSKIGQKLPLLSFIFKHLFGHRTLTHSLVFVLSIYFVLHMIETPIYYMISIICGMLSHIILDMLTPRGVHLFFPIPIRVRFPIYFKTGGLMDLSLATTFSLVTIYVLFESSVKHLILNGL
ncbi:metal-dependent hydrolase [Staphylococcus coagulans]|uniref:metal-dependent hydrolase n=1 Tax=Staphylococcus coagulans TaxID=74706 RepID=UPI0015F802B7|nr:metal-dependent hydrolase [Staphylococcus coagulans]MBA8762000.1 metal-dependent hydrolase [Staphylococcus coagulans]